MYKVEHIVVPVDFSESSRAAWAMARHFISPPPSIQLIHIMDGWKPYVRNILFPYAALGEDDVVFEHELAEEARRHLLHFLDIEDTPKADLKEPIVEMGHRKHDLVEHLRKQSSQLTIMGAHGEGGALPGVLGSTAERVIRGVSRPVLLVRGFERRPRIQRMVVAVDLTPASVEVFRSAVGLAIQTGAALHTLFVVPDPLTHDVHNLINSAIKYDRQQALKRARDKVEALVERMHNQADLPFATQEASKSHLKPHQTRLGDPAAEIVQFADKIDAQLIVVGSSDIQTPMQGHLGGTAWTVARNATTHVMVVPLQKKTALLDNSG